MGRLPLSKKWLANHLPDRTWGPSGWGNACLVGRIRSFGRSLSRLGYGAEKSSVSLCVCVDE